MQLLNVLVCNLANKPSFQNLTKRPFCGFWKDGILAELQVKMSRSCRFLLFLPHTYQVTLTYFWNDCNEVILVNAIYDTATFIILIHLSWTAFSCRVAAFCSQNSLKSCSTTFEGPGTFLKMFQKLLCTSKLSERDF